MDLNTIEALVRPSSRAELPAPAVGDAFLAGGTWLFSEPQRGLRRLVDLGSLGWPDVTLGPDTLILSATCTLASLDRYALESASSASAMIRRCCRALWGSFKVWNAATLGGNLCLALPAGPIAALAVALGAECVIWSGGGERTVAAAGFVLGPQASCLLPGEVLRCLVVPRRSLEARYAVRQASLTREGRSAALLIGRRDEDGFALVVTASVPRPLHLRFDALPAAAALRSAIVDGVAQHGWYDDVHGAPDWRAHMTLRLAGEILDELAACG